MRHPPVDPATVTPAVRRSFETLVQRLGAPVAKPKNAADNLHFAGYSIKLPLGKNWANAIDQAMANKSLASEILISKAGDGSFFAFFRVNIHK